MTARCCVAIASTAVAMAVAGTLTATGGAKTVVAGKHPRGLVLNCATQTGTGAGLRQFDSMLNLVVGPLAMSGAAGPEPDLDTLEPFGGLKYPVFVKGGYQVTLEVPRAARPGAGLSYGTRQHPSGNGYPVITFIGCRHGESKRAGSSGWPVSFWAGGILADSPRCVPLRIWVDDERSPRRAVVKVGVSACS